MLCHDRRRVPTYIIWGNQCWQEQEHFFFGFNISKLVKNTFHFVDKEIGLVRINIDVEGLVDHCKQQTEKLNSQDTLLISQFMMKTKETLGHCAVSL